MTRKKQIQILILSATNLIYTVPYLATTFYTQFQEGFGFSNQQIGQLIAWYGFTALFGYALGGWVADKISPKRLLMGACFSTAALGFVIAAGVPFGVMQIIYLLFGISTTFLQWGSLVKAIRLLGDESEQGRLFGAMEMWLAVISTISSYIVMALLGFIIKSVFGFAGVFLVYGGILILIGICIFIFIPNKQNTDSLATDFSAVLIWKAMKLPVTWFNAFIVLGMFIVQTAMTYMNPYLSGVFAVPVAVATGIGIFNKSFSRMFLSPLGGMVRDRMKSTPRFLLIWLSALLAVFAVMLIMPQKPSAATGAIVAVILFGSVVAFLRSGLYTPVAEAGTDQKITGTVIGIVSCIGYSSDLWLYTLCGKWIDTMGSAGYLNVIKLCMAGSIMTMIAAVGFGLYLKRRALTEDKGQAEPALAE